MDSEPEATGMACFARFAGSTQGWNIAAAVSITDTSGTQGPLVVEAGPVAERMSLI